MSPSTLFESLSAALHASDTIVDKAEAWASSHIEVARVGDPAAYRIAAVGSSNGRLVLTVEATPLGASTIPATVGVE